MSFLGDCFRLVVSLTLAGSLGVLLAAAGKAALGPRLSPGWGYRLWVLPLILFLVPFTLPLGGEGFLPAGSAAGIVEGIGIGGEAVSGASSAIPVGGSGALSGLRQSLAAVWEQALPVLAWVWLLGVLFLGAVRLVDHRSLMGSLDRCSCPPAEEGRAQKIFEQLTREMGIPEGRLELLLCPGVESPLLMGLLRPRIILPREDFPEGQLVMMLRHELNHYKGRDLWFKGAALGAACVHWFNPLAWYLAKDMDRCCELWCDCRTTGGMTAGERKQYGRMLLDVAQGSGKRAPAGAVTLAMNKEELKRRLTLLRSPRETTLLDRAVSLALALVVAVTGVVCSSAVNPGPLFAGVFQGESDPAPVLIKGNGEIPELWGDTPEEPGEILRPKSPQIRMQAVLSDEVVAPVPEEEAQPEPAPGSQPEPQPEEDPGSGAESAQPESPEDDPVPEPEPDPEPAPEPEPDPQDFCDNFYWSGSFLWPVNGGYISAGFNGYYSHSGVDIAADSGTEIYAAADGVVTYASNTSIWPYGKSILVRHGDGVETRYAHCSQVTVSVGDTVSCGDLIGLVGRTGNATGSHCHFEVILEGEKVDPAPYIAG